MAVFLHIPFGDEDGSGWQCFFIYLVIKTIIVSVYVGSFSINNVFHINKFNWSANCLCGKYYMIVIVIRFVGSKFTNWDII